jgi:hypothetical protein
MAPRRNEQVDHVTCWTILARSRTTCYPFEHPLGAVARPPHAPSPRAHRPLVDAASWAGNNLGDGLRVYRGSCTECRGRIERGPADGQTTQWVKVYRNRSANSALSPSPPEPSLPPPHAPYTVLILVPPFRIGAVVSGLWPRRGCPQRVARGDVGLPRQNAYESDRRPELTLGTATTAHRTLEALLRLSPGQAGPL